MKSKRAAFGAKQQIMVMVCVGLWTLLINPSAALTAQDIFRQASERIWVLETMDAKAQVISSSGAVLIQSGKAIVQCDVLQGAATVRLVRGEQRYRAEQMGGGDPEGALLPRGNGCALSSTYRSFSKRPYCRHARVCSEQRVGTRLEYLRGRGGGHS